jgi:hypothetical protein
MCFVDSTAWRRIIGPQVPAAWVARVSTTLVIALLTSACGLLPKATPDPGVPCDELYSEVDCRAMVDLSTTRRGISPEDVEAIAIAPNPTGPPGSTSGAPPIRLRLALRDGSTVEATICGGVSREAVCSAEPRASTP